MSGKPCNGPLFFGKYLNVFTLLKLQRVCIYIYKQESRNLVNKESNKEKVSIDIAGLEIQFIYKQFNI
jgi:hypothetical protein